MTNDVLKFDKKIAFITDDFIEKAGLSEQELSELKSLIVANYDLNIQRNHCINRSGYVPGDIVSSLQTNNEKLLSFMKKAKKVKPFVFLDE